MTKHYAVDVRGVDQETRRALLKAMGVTHPLSDLFKVRAEIYYYEGPGDVSHSSHDYWASIVSPARYPLRTFQVKITVELDPIPEEEIVVDGYTYVLKK